MLAYDLYLKNKGFQGRIVKNVKPIKKIYIDRGGITVDHLTLEEYGSKVSSDPLVSFLQHWLSMPLNNSDAERVNLPDKRTGSRSSPPYIQLFGKLEKTKSNEIKLKLSITGKDEAGEKKSFEAEFDPVKLEENFVASGNITLNLDKKNYLINNIKLFSIYVKSEIINEESLFSSAKFIEISKSFFEYVKHKSAPEQIKKAGQIFFEIYLLPSKEQIQHNDEHQRKNHELKSNFIDSFGNSNSKFPSKPSQTAKFLSFDDPAFSLNCQQQERFYENLHIGQESLAKINIPANDVFAIAGLYWIFTDLSDPSFEFKKTGRGIYSQLLDNYTNLKNKSGESESRQIQMKVICYKKQQAKIEILIDENMTMDRMKKVFEGNESINVPDNAFEILIENNGKTVIWHHYLDAVRALITGNTINRHQLIGHFTKTLRSKIFDWLKNHELAESRDFFKRSEFCIKNLLVSRKDRNLMNGGEKYAHSVGLIAGRYIRFKKQFGEESN